MPARRLAVGVTPMETRREVLLHVADLAEQLGYDAFFLAEGWGHDAGVLLAEIATRTGSPWARASSTSGAGRRRASRCWPPAWPR